MKNIFNSQNPTFRWTLRLINIALICLIFALLYSFHPVLLYIMGIVIQFSIPVVVALIFSMATYPLIQYFKRKHNWNNNLAKIVAICSVLVTLILFFAILIPLLINLTQTSFPKLKDVYEHIIIPFFDKMGLNVKSILRYINVSGIVGSITSFGSNFLFIIIMYLFIVIDIERTRIFIKKLIYTSKHENFIKFTKQFDYNFNNYIKALITYSGIAIIYYGLIIFMLALPFTYHNVFAFPWYMLGILFGVFVIVPYVGPIIGIAITSLAILNFGTPASLTMLIGLTIATQIDLNFIQLKIIGSKLKLNPIIILLTLLLSSSLFGFSGILITPILLVIIKTLLDVYAKKVDKLYKIRMKEENEESNNENI